MEVSSRFLHPSLTITSNTTFPSHDVSRSNINNLTNITNNKKLYTKASKINLSSNIEDILYIKKAFFTLLANKVVKIIKITNNNMGNKKLKINIMIKRLSTKQIIVPMNEINTEFIINLAHSHIININKYLKDIKLDIVADFICKVNSEIIITTNQIIANSDMKVIEKYLKNINKINLDSIESFYLLSFKLYIKITRPLYILEHINSPITSDILESVIKEIYIFNDIVLTSKP